MYLITFIRLCLCAMSTAVLLAKVVPFLRSSVLAHGKLQQTADRPVSAWANRIAQWTVPKSWFTHFYVVGFVFGLECAMEMAVLWYWGRYGPLMSFLRNWDDWRESDRACLAESMVAFTLLMIHLGRRMLEALVIEKHGTQTRIHCTHYLAGLGFYGAMVLATWLECARYLGVWGPYEEPPTARIHYGWAVAGVVLFVYASMHQYRCHCILASLRSQHMTYQIPQGDWFDVIVAPHYFADILIYLALCIVCRFSNLTLWCGLLWTLLNLSVSASETKRWYQKTFGERYSLSVARERWIIIPFVY